MMFAGAVRAAHRRRGPATRGRMHRARRTSCWSGCLSAYQRGRTTVRRGFRRQGICSRRECSLPTSRAIRIAEQKPALPEVFVVRIDAAADMTIGVRPGACLDVDALSDEPDRGPSLEGFDQGAFRFLVENGLAS